MGYQLDQIALAGLSYICFKKWEPSGLLSLTALLVALPLLPDLISSANAPTSSSLPDSMAILLQFITFYFTLLICVIAYRISPFHPLSRYPGPILCRVTKLWGMWISMGGKLHIHHKGLHDLYGPVVRVGPNELSIVHKSAIPPVLGNKGMPRGPLWDGRRNRQLAKGRKYISVIDVRDNQIHAQLRKRWNEAFSADCVKDYQELLISRANQLCVHIEKLCGPNPKRTATLDMAKWISFFSFDFMGDLAFGGGFELMNDQDVDGNWHRMEVGMTHASIIQHAPWVSAIFQSLPFLSSGMRKFGRFAMEQARLRIATASKRKDLFYHLYESSADPSTPLSYEAQLSAAVTDSSVTIIAGSDTSASALSSIICFLLCHPDKYAMLRQELDHAFPDVDPDGRRVIETDKLASLPYLNAVMYKHFVRLTSVRLIHHPRNEGLRLLPPVPTSIQRASEKGSGGKIIGNSGIYIPEGTAIYIPPYAFHRDPRYFSPFPDSFIPERWLSPANSENKFITDRDAYIPFSYGPANCVGKPLALLEIRYVLALLLQRFDMCMSHFGDTNPDLVQYERKWEDGLKDRFVFSKGELGVTVRIR